MLTVSGCASKEARLIAAADAKGRMAAGVRLPDLPEECRQPMERVIPKYGVEKPRNTQLRWEVAADLTDRRIGRCASFYDGVKTRFDVTKPQAAQRSIRQ
ncbi:hypothetical protein QE408_004124 [Agrobacterium larrymoorei]|uniref:Lipoprotein n=2 Tax=Agrobacterium larrymoorei TaxID=160699 RepID=A0ABU0UQ54_9HYPH|nr:hypothetical protein [Agrobacterium larrymoorei]